MPAETLPDVLRHIAEWNPVSVLVAAVRDMFGNTSGQTGAQPWPIEHAVPLAFLTCAVMLVVVVPLSLRRYRERTID